MHGTLELPLKQAGAAHLWREVEGHIQVLLSGAHIRMLAPVHPALQGWKGGGGRQECQERRPMS